MKRQRQSTGFDTVDDVDVNTAMEMIRVGIVPTTEIDPVGFISKLHGDIPVEALGERSREQFLQAVKTAGLPVNGFDTCPPYYKFQAIRAIHRS